MKADYQKKLILEFAEKHRIGVLATQTPAGNPEAATITIAMNDKFEVIFQTFTTYRKYKNLRSNKNIALVIGWDNKITVQYEGTAEELHDENLANCKEEYFRQNPATRKWGDLPDAAWFKISPKWIHYLDNRTDPKTKYEIMF